MGPQFHFERSRTSRDPSSSDRESPVLNCNSSRLANQYIINQLCKIYIHVQYTQILIKFKNARYIAPIQHHKS